MYICKLVKNDIIFSERRKMVDGKSLTSASKVEEESFSSPPPGLFCEKLFHFRCVDKIPCHIFFPCQSKLDSIEVWQKNELC